MFFQAAFGIRRSATPNKRQRAYRLGHRAEFLAAWGLRLKGYRILEQRFKTPVGEVDLIARRGDLVIFVEVKARREQSAALDSVSRTAQRRIEAAGEWWLARRPDFAQLSWRCDVVAVTPRRWPPFYWPVHFENVW